MMYLTRRLVRSYQGEKLRQIKGMAILSRRLFIIILVLLLPTLVFYNFIQWSTFNHQQLNKEDQSDISLQQALSKIKTLTDEVSRLRTNPSKSTKTICGLSRNLEYWKYTQRKKTPYPIVPDKFVIWHPWHGGLNNQRMSLELAYTFAFVTNRTLVLPKFTRRTWPFTIPLNFDMIFELEDMKSGWAVLTQDEFEALPNYQQVMSNIAILNWTDLQYSASGFVWPAMPDGNMQDELWHYYEWRKWRWTKEPEKIVPHHPGQEPRFFEANVLQFPFGTLFTHYYLFYHFTKWSTVNINDLTEVIRDHVHFKAEIMVYVHKILDALPECYSSIHYRRDDLNPVLKDSGPLEAYNNTLNLFFEGEHIYMSTDENAETMEKDVKPVWNRRYTLHHWSMYSHLVPDIPLWYIPKVEEVLCSQGRVFVGTRGSTMSGYMNRLRGYMNIPNKNYYFTAYHYPSYYYPPRYDSLVDPYRKKDWMREYPISYEVTQSVKY
eukprot:TRINITY_DN5115_c0_g1_i1.p1 TRINITY_DN5115_c0_g1~~TRINITY_DN5115_c0_g1_i1.p1  ORF type:complete len:491 (-),score=60.22 TRINITY_DN5115_c0_g1_i1:139-1611(-)